MEIRWNSRKQTIIQLCRFMTKLYIMPFTIKWPFMNMLDNETYVNWIGVFQSHTIWLYSVLDEDGLPVWHSSTESACQFKRSVFDPWEEMISWHRTRQPAPVYMPGKFHGQRSRRAATVHGAVKSQTCLSDWAHTYTLDEDTADALTMSEYRLN